MAAKSFAGTTGSVAGRQQFPIGVTDTLSATPWQVRQLNVPDGAEWVFIRFESVDGRYDFTQTFTDNSDVLSAILGLPVIADTWHPIYVGASRNNQPSRITKIYLASATASARFYARAEG